MAIVLSYYGNRESDAALDQAVRLASWMRTSLMMEQTVILGMFVHLIGQKNIIQRIGLSARVFAS